MNKENKEKISNIINKTSGKFKEQKDKVNDKVMSKLDVNGDGNVDVEDIIIAGLKIPGIVIKRDEFLRKELKNKYSDEIIEKAIETTPIQAGVKLEDINYCADEVIAFERNCVSGISALLSSSGGAAMVATIPADIAQYYGYMLRVAQKLMYLYGFPEIEINGTSQFDSATLNTLTICLGVMYGLDVATKAIKNMAIALSRGVEKKIMQTALTKGTFYPIVKEISKWFGVKMTKQVFSNFFKKAIPVIGGVIGGGMTYLSFKPCCEKLKTTLKDTALTNREKYNTDIIDAEVVEFKEDNINE